MACLVLSTTIVFCSKQKKAEEVKQEMVKPVSIPVPQTESSDIQQTESVIEDTVDPHNETESYPQIETESGPVHDTVTDPTRNQIAENCRILRELTSRFSANYGYRYFDASDYRNEYPDSVNTRGDSIRNEWEKLQEITYELIQSYKQDLSSGKRVPDIQPIMLLGNGVVDSLSIAKLPQVDSSTFLEDHEFFFLGAGPFLQKSWDESDTTVYQDLSGKPEVRFMNEISGNIVRVMRMLRSFENVSITTLDGEPISVGHHEEDCPWEKSVKGIGSLIHVLDNNFPVYFITEKGLVKGRLVKVKDKLFEAYQGCVSDLPSIYFACSKNPPAEILGVYIPYKPLDISSCTVKRKKNIWTVDLTGDGVPEIAGVSTGWEGVSGTINKIIWYGNVSGSWQVIDSAEDMDCT